MGFENNTTFFKVQTIPLNSLEFLKKLILYLDFQAIGQDDPQQQVQQQPLQEIQADDNRAAGIERKVNHLKGQALSIGNTSTIIAKNGKLPGKSSTTEVNENNENKQGPAGTDSLEDRDGYRPRLIWPALQPHTVLLCYSSADK